MTRPVVSPAFVGRREQLSDLADAYRRAREEGATLALVAGEAGIGKSRFVAEFLRCHGSGVRIFTGECLELGGDGLPYAPFVAVVRLLVRRVGVAAVAAMLPGERHELASWLPVLGEPGEGPGGKARLFEEVLGLFETMADEEPTVVVLEDLHWADPSSRELLLFLVRNLDRPGLLIVGTYRSEEAEPLSRMLSGLGRGARTHRIELPRFDRVEVGAQLAAIGGGEPDPAVVACVHQRSEGIPLFVEALDVTTDRTPAGVRELLLAGLTNLPVRSRAVLRAASAIGVRVRHDLLAGGLGLDDAQLAEALRPLVDRYLVSTEDGYLFRHALIRAAVYEGLLPGERIRLHSRYAEALTGGGAAAAELAAHWYAAGDLRRAQVTAWAAAGEAGRSFAYAERLRMLERVLELWEPDSPERIGVERVDLLTWMVRTCVYAGEFARGIALATEALDALDPTREPERVAALLGYRGRLAYQVGDLEAALRFLPDGSPDVVRGRTLALLASARLSEGDLADVREPAEEVIRLGRLTGDRILLARGLALIGIHRALSGDTEPWEPPLAAAEAIARDHNDPELLVVTALYEARAAAEMGFHQRTVAAAERGMTVAHRFGLDRSSGVLLAVFRVEALYALGEWGPARDATREALSLDPPKLFRDALLTLRGLIDVAEGDLDAARTAPHGVGPADPVGNPFASRHAEFAIQLAMAEGDDKAARKIVEAVLAGPGVAGMLRIWHFLPEAARVIPDGPLGETLRDLVATAPTHGPFLALCKATAEAELAGVDASTWDEVAAGWRGLGQPDKLARSLCRAAETALAAADRSGAAERLREAARIAEDLGAVPLVREIAALAARGRVELPGTAAKTPSTLLTARERDVLGPLSEGLTNRQIAARLFISPNTAGVHVSRILAKLGARSRTEAASIARRDGLLPE